MTTKTEYQAIVAENDVRFNFDLKQVVEQGWVPVIETFQAARGDYAIIAVMCTRTTVATCTECAKPIYGNGQHFYLHGFNFHDNCWLEYAKRHGLVVHDAQLIW